MLDGAAITSQITDGNDDHEHSENGSGNVDEQKLSAVVLEVDAHGPVLAHRVSRKAHGAYGLFLAILAVGHTAFTFGGFLIEVVRLSALNAFLVVRGAPLATEVTSLTFALYCVQKITGVAL